jgi:hypothetical protein
MKRSGDRLGGRWYAMPDWGIFSDNTSGRGGIGRWLDVVAGPPRRTAVAGDAHEEIS